MVAQSSTEAEYIALDEALKELLWLKQLILDFKVELDEVPTIFEDNQSCIALAENKGYRARSKHIDVRYHFSRYHLAEGTYRLEYCPTADMVADSLTKALSRVPFERFRNEMMIFDQNPDHAQDQCENQFLSDEHKSVNWFSASRDRVGRHDHGQDRAHVHDRLIQEHRARRMARIDSSEQAHYEVTSYGQDRSWRRSMDPVHTCVCACHWPDDEYKRGSSEL